VIHLNWATVPTIKKLTCIHTNAAKFMVDHALTEGKVYEVKNETDEFYFVIDNTGKVSGFYKEYFEELAE
jgi:hypothetical protein